MNAAQYFVVFRSYLMPTRQSDPEEANTSKVYSFSEEEDARFFLNSRSDKHKLILVKIC